MTDQAQGFYAVHKPTSWERIVKFLGFGRHWDEALFEWRNQEPQTGDWFVPSVFSTHTIVRIDWKDRLRILLSGRVEVICFSKMNVVVNRAESRSEFVVLAPGARR